MNHPDFLVVGTARAGTTALHYYLRQHPELYLPSQKEPCFYCFAGEENQYKGGKFAFAVRKKRDYEALFKPAPPGSVKGEISTPYLYLYDKTISNIRALHPDPEKLRIIIILRDPVSRAYSQYLWRVRDGRESLSFDEALRQEKKRMLQNYSFDYFYAHRGLYAKQVEAYMKAFPSTKIFLHDEFRSDPQGTLSSLCEFLNVDAEFKFERRHDINSSNAPRFNSLGRIITFESRVKYKLLNILPDSVRLSLKQQFLRMNRSGRQLPPMSDSAREYLQDYYKEDLQRLQEFTGLNLSAWVKA